MLDGERLDEESRTLAVADVFEALTAARPYRDGIPVPQVVDMLRVEAGAKLDAEMVDTLLGCIDGEGEISVDPGPSSRRAMAGSA